MLSKSCHISSRFEAAVERSGHHLDTPYRLTTLSAMDATVRNFTRKFPLYRQAARAGRTIRIQDRDGVTYVFAREQTDPASLMEVAGSFLGSVNSGVRRKSLKGYGKD